MTRSANDPVSFAMRVTPVLIAAGAFLCALLAGYRGAAGALIGGGLGTIGGGSRKSQSYKANFEDGFIDCMSGRAQ